MVKSGEPILTVKNLHKDFVLPQEKHTTLKQAVVGIVRKNGKTTQQVLRGIDFVVNKGDFLGIVGRNGSGKSTLLKLIAGVYTPTSGQIIVNGGLTPFIELGVGFNPELTGRDNVFLNGALLGFNHKQMEAMYEEIVTFAELGPYMGQKLKNFSSGMQVRLAFSIAIKAKNEVLIFDEVLAVGDEAFQRKCMDVFEKYRAEGQTVILVTHNMNTVREYCNKALLIKDGEVAEIGSPRKVSASYSALNQEEIDSSVGVSEQAATGPLKVDTLGVDSVAKNSFQVGQSMKVNIAWDMPDPVYRIGVNIFKLSGEHMTGINSESDKVGFVKKSSASLDIDLMIRPGRYYLLIELFRRDGLRILSNEINPNHFSVLDSSKLSWSGLVFMNHNWK